VIGGDPIPHGLLHELEELLFGHFVIGLHACHLKCMHSFEHGLDNVDLFHKSKDNQICLFLPWGHASFWGVRWVTTWWHMQWNMCQFCTFTLTPTEPNLNWRTPKLLDGFNYKSKGEDNGRRRNWGALPGSQHFAGRGVCWSFEMGLGRLISNSITHTDLHKPNNKLVSA
jgi:hypothetical protein